MTGPRRRILGVIPARGGSKGIHRKNLVKLAGRPLIAHTIEAGLKSRSINRLIVSTDDDEIATVSRHFGAEVPFVRPDELATDRAPSLPVIRHALEFAESDEKRRYDIVVMLQPTTPLRSGEDIDRGVDLLVQTEADSVVSVVDVGAYHPNRMKRLLDNGRLENYIDLGFEDMRPRQELPSVYIRSGDLYINKREVIMTMGTLVGPDCRGIVIPQDRAINIDAPRDLLIAEHLIANLA